MNTQLILKYLSDLSENNNRKGYHARKAENKAANTEFETLIEALIVRIGKYETSVSYTDLCNIASTACDMHVEVSLTIACYIMNRKALPLSW